MLTQSVHFLPIMRTLDEEAVFDFSMIEYVSESNLARSISSESTMFPLQTICPPMFMI